MKKILHYIFIIVSLPSVLIALIFSYSLAFYVIPETHEPPEYKLIFQVIALSGFVGICTILTFIDKQFKEPYL